MHGAARPDEAGPEEFEQAIHLQKDPPETARIFGIKSCMGSILVKTNWVRHLFGPLANFHFYPEVTPSLLLPQLVSCSDENRLLFLALVTQGPHVSRDRLEMFV
jgi:hypothetical protein